MTGIKRSQKNDLAKDALRKYFYTKMSPRLKMIRPGFGNHSMLNFSQSRRLYKDIQFSPRKLSTLIQANVSEKKTYTTCPVTCQLQLAKKTAEYIILIGL